MMTLTTTVKDTSADYFSIPIRETKDQPKAQTGAKQNKQCGAEEGDTRVTQHDEVSSRSSPLERSRAQSEIKSIGARVRARTNQGRYAEANRRLDDLRRRVLMGSVCDVRPSQEEVATEQEVKNAREVLLAEECEEDRETRIFLKVSREVSLPNGVLNVFRHWMEDLVTALFDARKMASCGCDTMQGVLQCEERCEIFGETGIRLKKSIIDVINGYPSVLKNRNDAKTLEACEE